MVNSGPFSAGALELNRSGRLSDEQKKILRSLARSARGAMRSFALIAAGLAAILLFLADKGGALRILGGVALLIVAGFFFVRSLLGADLVDDDLRAGRVESVEGPIFKRKETTHTHGSQGSTTSTEYYLDVTGKSMRCFRDQFEAAPDAGYVRVYYMPRSTRVVNLEQLADKPVATGVASSPRDLVKLAVSGLVGSEESRAEARAQMAAIGHGIVPGAQPPPSERDPRPLAEAILGRWTNGMMTLRFDADGTASATLPGGMQRTAHWSVDPEGRLVADLMGEQEAREAWVANDRLSITQGGSGLMFTRA